MAASVTSGQLFEARFRALFEGGPVAQVDVDVQGVILSVNLALLRLLGRTRDELVGQPAAVLLHPDDDHGQMADLQALRAGQITSYERQRVYSHADGHQVHVLAFASRVDHADGSLRQITGLVLDLTPSYRLQSELLEAHEHLQGRNEYLHGLLDSIDLGIVACDEKGRLTEFNPTARRWHGLDPDGELAPEQFAQRFSLYEVDGVTPLTTARVPLVRALLHGEVRDAEFVIAPADLPAVRVVTQGRALVAADGRLLGAVVAMHDVTTERALQEQLAFRAFHDDLTGLPNRALLAEQLEHALAQRIRGASRGVAVLMLDLDAFKAVNDSYGHDFGDLLLVQVSATLAARCRDGDTVARLGGDEFAIVLPDADVTLAMQLGERLTEALRQPFQVQGRALTIGSSIGVVIADGQDRSTLLRQADIALYVAKEAGGSTVALFDAAMHEQALDRLRLELELRGAADRGELVLEYQPVLRLSSNEMVSVEALVRWEHPTRGRIPPMSFIPLAQDSGSIRAIGRWVLRTACAQLLAWDRDHPHSQLSMAVNLSPRQLVDPDLVAEVGSVLAELQVEPSRIVLEITESALGEDVERMIEKLLGLKRLGVRLAIDDFGTGFSSLSYLRRLPIDILKVDKSFVSGIAITPEEWSLTTAIIRLANSLGTQTLAEGIELAEQLAHLLALSCEFGQGYLFSRPVPPAGIAERLASLSGPDAGEGPSR